MLIYYKSSSLAEGYLRCEGLGLSGLLVLPARKMGALLLLLLIFAYLYPSTAAPPVNLKIKGDLFVIYRTLSLQCSLLLSIEADGKREEVPPKVHKLDSQ